LAVGDGVDSANVSATFTGGFGGATTDGATTGKGGDALITTAQVRGSTDGGTLTLLQKAVGGGGGQGFGQQGGAAGTAQSDLTFDDTLNVTTSDTVKATAQAQGGIGGAGSTVGGVGGS